jgi:DNA end-binding protein Ku
MSGAYTWKGAVQFGPAIQFNVAAKSAVKEQRFAFNKHHAECGGRLAQGGMTCLACGETNLEKDDIVRGYGGVAGVDEEYLESLEAEKRDILVLDGLVPVDQIDPRYFQKSYDVTPDVAGRETYVLFMQVLVALKRVAIGKVVMGGKEYIVCFRPHNGILAMELLYWPEELVPSIEAQTAIEDVKISAKILTLGKALGEQLSVDFNPAAYKNDFVEDMTEYLDGFVNGNVPTPIASRPKKAAKVSSLEDALAASLTMLPDKPKKARKTA